MRRALALIACSWLLLGCDRTLPPDDKTDGGVDAPTTLDSQAPQPDGPTPDTKPPPQATWVTIKKGTFTMGSPPTEPCREKLAHKETQHQVTLTRDFEIQATEVTQAQFKAQLGYNPAYFKACGSSCPVDWTTWHEAAAYCNALSKKAGKAACYTCSGKDANVQCDAATAYSGQKIYTCPGYRLPTEAEWEYAYRAGTTTAYYSGANNPLKCDSCPAQDANAVAIGWHLTNSKVSYSSCMTPPGFPACSCLGTHPVALKQSNAWGLYDMAGNVAEWCHDWQQSDLGSTATTDPWGAASGNNKLLRGGSFGSFALYLRAADRFATPPAGPYYTTGFRCVRTITP